WAITVGASNSHGTDARNDDTITTYTSRGPTRSFFTDANGRRVYDNLIKPDLVAPGNEIISYRPGSSLLGSLSPELVLPLGLLETNADGVMYQSGTSMSAPIVSGAVAMLLEENPKLTPQMIRMLLQYSAQPIAGANSFEQGAGQLNIEGAVRLAKSLRDVDYNSLSKGASMVPGGWSMPQTSTTISGHTFPWAQLVQTNYSYLTGHEL